MSTLIPIDEFGNAAGKMVFIYVPVEKAGVRSREIAVAEIVSVEEDGVHWYVVECRTQDGRGFVAFYDHDNRFEKDDTKWRSGFCFVANHTAADGVALMDDWHEALGWLQEAQVEFKAKGMM